MAVFCPTDQEAQTAAGVRGSRFLPKTARRAPQALEAGAFWADGPKTCPLPVHLSQYLMRRVYKTGSWAVFGGTAAVYVIFRRFSPAGAFFHACGKNFCQSGK